MNSLGISSISIFCLFVGFWVWSMKIRNAGIVDVVWALGLMLPVTLFAYMEDGALWRRLLTMAMAALWSLRLGLSLADRVAKKHPEEDRRYAAMRDVWPEHQRLVFFAVFLINALLVFLLSLPSHVAMKNAGEFSIFEGLGILVFIVGFLGEALADRQLAHHRKSENTAICQVGLWKYSRHPNYFFEAVIWVGFWLFACGSPGGFYTIHAPLIMIILLTKVTGIPPNERHQLARKGDTYRDYQRTTSAFVPWFKKNAN